MAPKSNLIFSAGDPAPVIEDLPPTIEMDVIPEMLDNIAYKNTNQMETFFLLHSKTEVPEQPKLLTHSGHGSVTILQSDTPLGKKVSATTTRTTIRIIMGTHWLGTPSANCPSTLPTMWNSGGYKRVPRMSRSSLSEWRHAPHVAVRPSQRLQDYFTGCGRPGGIFDCGGKRPKGCISIQAWRRSRLGFLRGWEALGHRRSDDHNLSEHNVVEGYHNPGIRSEADGGHAVFGRHNLQAPHSNPTWWTPHPSLFCH